MYVRTNVVLWFGWSLLSAAGPGVPVPRADVLAARPGCDAAQPAGVVISEIMYHPCHGPYEAENTGLEWIELFNNGAEPVRLDRWRFSDGVDFVFPHVVLGPGQYLVVAADPNAFAGVYPDVDHVIGGWRKRLSNSGETLELVDEAGVRIDALTYADEGDWAVRELGPVDHGHRGWLWADDHDGGGKSLERVNLRLCSGYGRNWRASEQSGGTPGRLNSVYRADAAPMIVDARHHPAVPDSVTPVTVTCRVVDETTSDLQVVLHHRPDAADDFSEQTMHDDGRHADGDAADGTYGARIEPHADGTVVEFYIEARDEVGGRRTWPALACVDGVPAQVANALYVVDDSAALDPAAGIDTTVSFYLVLTGRELAELNEIGDKHYEGRLFAGEAMSNAEMNATFISVGPNDTDVRYRVGVRNRGNRKRADPPMSYRVNFPTDGKYNGARALNLNSKYPHLELMGSVLFRMAGVAAADVGIVRLSVNGAEPAQSDYGRTYGFYSAVEVLDADWAERHFPHDDNGNLYRCTYYDDAVHPKTYADLYYKEDPGDTPEPNAYRDNYPKQTNKAADDWTDLFALIDTLNNPDILDDEYVTAVGEVTDLPQWLRFLAADALMGNREGGLTSGSGDDYALYRGVEDRRFVLVPHDLDTVLGQGDHSYQPDRDIFVYADVRGLRRLLNHPQVVQLYYAQYRDLARTVFSPESFDPMVDELLGPWVPDREINGPTGIKQFMRDRLASILYGGYPDPDTAPQIPPDSGTLTPPAAPQQ